MKFLTLVLAVLLSFPAASREEPIRLDEYLKAHDTAGPMRDVLPQLPWIGARGDTTRVSERELIKERFLPDLHNRISVSLNRIADDWGRHETVVFYRLRGVGLYRSTDEQTLHARVADLDFSTMKLRYSNVIKALARSKEIDLEAPGDAAPRVHVRFAAKDGSWQGIARFAVSADPNRKKALRESYLLGVQVYDPAAYDDLRAYYTEATHAQFAYITAPELGFAYANIPHPSVGEDTSRQVLKQEKAGYAVYEHFGKPVDPKQTRVWLFNKNNTVNKEMYGVILSDDRGRYMDIYDYPTRTRLYTLQAIGIQRDRQSAFAQVVDYPVDTTGARQFTGRILNTGAFFGTVCEATGEESIHNCFYSQGAHFDELPDRAPSYAHRAVKKPDEVLNRPVTWVDAKGQAITDINLIYPERLEPMDTYRGHSIYAVYRGEIGTDRDELKFVLLPTGDDRYKYLMLEAGRATQAGLHLLFDDTVLSSLDWRDYVGVVPRADIGWALDGSLYSFNGAELFEGFAGAQAVSQEEYAASQSRALAAKREQQAAEQRRQELAQRAAHAAEQARIKEALREYGEYVKKQQANALYDVPKPSKLMQALYDHAARNYGNLTIRNPGTATCGYTVTSDDGGYESGSIGPGETISVPIDGLRASSATIHSACALEHWTK